PKKRVLPNRKTRFFDSLEKAVSFFDFPQGIEIVRSNMLYIPTEALSAKAQNQVKRLAAFKNPDFYRSQAMRLPIYNKPRVICTAEIYDRYIALPRGCEEALCDLLDSVSVSYSFNDKTNGGIEIAAEFNGTLRTEQQPAVDAMLKHNTGILSATTAFGKTVVASCLIGIRKTNTLILVHTQSLMTQWQKSLERFLDLKVEPSEQVKSRGRKKTWSPVGMLGAGKNTLNGAVDVAVMQSLISGDEVKELVRDYGMIIVDECHHVSAVSFEKILKFADAKYVYGLTATPTRQDGHHPILFMQCGPIRYRVDARSQAEKRSFEHYLIPRFTSFRSTNRDKNITEIYKDLAESEFRNSYIVNDIQEALKSGRTPIVLTERREHVLLLADRLSGECKNIVTLFGTASQKERREKSEQLERISDNEPLVIIAIGRYVGEGFDFPRLDTLFLALPISWKGKVAQYAGRLHRNFPGKTEVQIYDYVDIHIPMLEKMYQKRLKSYSSIGYKIRINNTEQTLPDFIYDTENFYGVYRQDMISAKKEILIVSPFMRKSRIMQLVKILSQAILNGVSVTVIARSPECFTDNEQQTVMDNAELLKGYGCNVIFKPDFHQKFTVMDNRIVWYGSINFLSFGKAEESVMRLSSYDIAGQLLDTVL
ncbi:MAG: DEAD/DEAH box helicase family protein, partial [Acutalibacteraceae bacterium]